MTVADRIFGLVAEELATAHVHKTSLCAPFLRVLPVNGAAISTLGSPFGTETVCASDATSARVDELQFDLGEGPCWEALSTRRPVLATDLRGGSNPRWPVFQKAMETSGIGSLYAFPLVIGTLDIGAVDLYSRRPGSLTTTQLGNAVTLAALAARQVLRRAITAQPVKPEDDDTGYSRRVVHQATGMVLVQLNVSAADALLMLHGNAFASGRTVREVAADVVARRIDFSSDLLGF